jgi:hypothetical protein
MKNFKFSLLLYLLLICNITNAQMLWMDASATIKASENPNNVSNLFDNDLQTTWSCTGSGNIIFENLSNDFEYTGYFLYTAAANVPASWKFYGSNDGVNYTLLNSQTGVILSPSTRTRFHTTNTTIYSYYKIELFDSADFVSSGDIVELSAFIFEIGGKTESFNKHPIVSTATNVNGTYTGDNGIIWTYTHCRDGQAYGSEGKSLMVRGNDVGDIKATLLGGITKLSFDYSRSFTDGSYFKVFITDSTGVETLIGTTNIVTATAGIQTFVLDSLDYRENVLLRIEGEVSPIVIDNLGYFPNPLAIHDTTILIKNAFSVNIDSVKWRISDYLVGMHSVYSFDPDTLYADGSYAAWMKSSGVSTMRYPGGTVVKFWDWENPTGILDKDSWNPNWNVVNNMPPQDWTSLDEYIAVVKSSGIKPLFGVNITSGFRYDRVQESIDRAAKMVQHVKDAGLGGAFYYLGNEGENGSPANEANLFKQHAQAMKKIDPTIKCMFNENNLTPEYLKNYLAIAGDYIDIAETHGKWPYGGDPDNYAPGTFLEWQTEFPLRDRKNHNRKWRNEVPSLQLAAVKAGYPDLKFADNEYGLGKSVNRTGFDKYSNSLLVIDMLQEHFIGNWYMACYWSQVLGDDTGVVDASQNFKFNPMHFGFELLAKAQGGNMLDMTDVKGDISVYGFAAEKNGEYLVYLLNKSFNEQSVNLSFLSSQATTLQFIEGSSMVNTTDLFGEMISLSASNQGSNGFTSVLSPMSYTRLTFKKLTSGTNGLSKAASNIKVYPNPTKDVLTLEGLSINTIKNFTVYDVNGKNVKSGELNNSKTINLQGIPNGNYIIKFVNTIGVPQYVKIVKK